MNSQNRIIQLSADGKTLTAYPGPSDVLAKKPIALADGYLLIREKKLSGCKPLD